jgi:hypothetical protein
MNSNFCPWLSLGGSMEKRNKEVCTSFETLNTITNVVSGQEIMNGVGVNNTIWTTFFQA